MKLYTNPQSRGARVSWTLAELGVPCETVILDMKKGEHRSEEFKKISPFNQLPAFEDNGVTIIESGAICVYLADKYPDKQLGAGDQPAEYFQWCFYCFGSLEPAMMGLLMHTRYLPEERRSAVAAEMHQEQFTKVLGHLEGHMKGREFLLGKRFSVADILVGGSLQWASDLVPAAQYPNLTSYIGRLAARQRPTASV
jgi:glutathione S-transferase